MIINPFPPLDLADEYGLLAVGGDLTVKTLVLAYRSGIFPWPLWEEDLVTWFSPPQRALLFFNEFHPSKKLKKIFKKTPYTFSINKNFDQTIHCCAELINRKDSSTWIKNKMIQAYIDLHHAGYAHSFECYEGEELIGGLYGVKIGKMFAGESMFYRKPNASKLCFCFLVEHLKSLGHEWIDCQQLTPQMESFGARLISREEFILLLKKAIDKE